MACKKRLKLKKLLTKFRPPTELFGTDRAALMSDSTPQNGSVSDSAAVLSSSAPTPTVAAFSPNQQTASRTKNQQSILIHQKSPLLIATPPQVTRALAYSHPFILPLNHVFGLLAWSTDDPWESFLLLTCFWFVVLYGDAVTRWAGPVVLVAVLIFGMYSRRYSPLSSTVWSEVKKTRKRADSEHRKSLDEILDTLQTFTERCEVLLDPFMRLTEYLSTQSTATSATTRPALTTLFIRLLAVTPIWIALSFPPLRLITTKRVVLALGTIILSFHSQPARVSRTVLWRSQTVRSTTTLLTGLHFTPTSSPSPVPDDAGATAAKAKARTRGKKSSEPIRFTFAIYENQRRWIGLGWTVSLFAYEREAWTDEHLNPVPNPDSYDLPETDNTTTKWRWAVGSEWHVEGALINSEQSAKRPGGGGGGDDSGWIYFDNKWQDGRREDGWSRYTRCRKWIRDAELVEVDPETGTEIDNTANLAGIAVKDMADTASVNSATSPSVRKRGWFSRNVNGGSDGAVGMKRPPNPRSHSHNPSMSSLPDNATTSTDKTSVKSFGSARSTRSAREDEGEDMLTPIERVRRFDWDRTYSEGVAEQLS